MMWELVCYRMSQFPPPPLFFRIARAEADASAVKTVVLTSGKLYYDLAKRREAEGRDDVAIVRLEEYAPFPADAILDPLSVRVWCLGCSDITLFVAVVQFDQGGVPTVVSQNH